MPLDDDRELGSPVLELACDTPDCPGIVRIREDDWRDNDANYCHACVLAVVTSKPDTTNWPEDLWF
jgi:hypothetical protein